MTSTKSSNIYDLSISSCLYSVRLLICENVCCSPHHIQYNLMGKKRAGGACTGLKLDIR